MFDYFIQIGEYVEWKQPSVWQVLVRRYLCFVRVDWERIMRERPKPGRAGLLEGEKAV